MISKNKRGGRTRQVMVYDMKSDLCVWSAAGVLKPIICVYSFDCLGCPVERKMRQEIKEGRLKDGRVLAGRNWSGEVNRRPIKEKKCRHMLSGRVSVKYCVNDYDCAHCEYHQLMMDESLTEPLGRPEQEIVGGFSVARNCYYHSGHTWARVEYGGRVRVGLDDFAERLFGPFSRFQLPRLGQAIRQGAPGFGVIRGELGARFLSPMDGVVAAVNPAAGENGGVRDDPYGRGWLLVLEPQNVRLGLRNLLFLEESLAWMEEEVSRLMAMLPGGEDGCQLAATGGQALSNIYGLFPGLGWDSLVGEFLGAQDAPAWAGGNLHLRK
ncbi:MAG: glycine cleavage system protein H [Pseudomonadota bacterium]